LAAAAFVVVVVVVVVAEEWEEDAVGGSYSSSKSSRSEYRSISWFPAWREALHKHLARLLFFLSQFLCHVLDLDDAPRDFVLDQGVPPPIHLDHARKVVHQVNLKQGAVGRGDSVDLPLARLGHERGNSAVHRLDLASSVKSATRAFDLRIGTLIASLLLYMIPTKGIPSSKARS
jgi:hypothetical protein